MIYFFQNFNFLDADAMSSNFSLTHHPAAKPITSPIVKNILFSLLLLVHVFIQ